MTTNPNAVHTFPVTALKKNMILQAAVKSVEDHGYIMDIGIGGTKAFLPKKKAQKFIEEVL